MSERLKIVNIIIGFVLVVILPLVGCGYSQGPELNHDLKPAPDFNLNDVYGRPFKLSSYLGKVVVINFWASTCPPCIIEMPEFQAVYEKMGEKAILVSISPQDSDSFIRDFIQKRGYGWVFISDIAGVSAIAYGIAYFPTTFILDTKGRLAMTQVGGPISRDFIESAIEKVLALS
jgi:peroxiredoxin